MKNLGYGLTWEHLKKNLRWTYAKLSINVVSAVLDPQITRYNIRTSADPHFFTEFTEASSTADTAGMSRHRLAPYTVHYLKTLLILAISGS